MLTRLSRSLCAWRDRKGLDQKGIATALDVDESSVSLWFAGKRTPTVSNLEKLAALFGIDVSEIWNGPQAVPASRAMKVLVDKAGHLSEAQLVMLASVAESMTPHKE